MKTTFYLDGKKVTKKAMIEMFGASKVKQYIEEAKEIFFEDPYVANDIMTAHGMLSIEFS